MRSLKTLYFWRGIAFAIAAGFLGSVQAGSLVPIAWACAVAAVACWIFPGLVD